MRNRRAVSLTELLIVINVAAAVFTICGQLMHGVMSGQRAAHQEAEMQLVAGRLSELFRNDAHRANVMVLSPDTTATQISLQMPDGESIEYVAENQVLRRTHRRADATIHRDEFAFPPGWQIVFQELVMPNRVALTVWSDVVQDRPADPAIARGDDEHRRSVFRVEAVIARDHRFFRREHDSE